MCRFLAYCGQPILLESLVAAPCHSLVHQSKRANEGEAATNADGFGVGWYGERAEPGIYRELRPAWSDENLRSLCAQVRARMFFAHVRAAIGSATTRANCHPFAVGRYLFMHNGQIGGWQTIRRSVEAMIPDRLYTARQGTTDSEAILLAAMGSGLADDPARAIATTLAGVGARMRAAGVRDPLRFTAALTDGERIWAFRWASDDRPPSLYWREGPAGITVVSEPIDDARDGWHPVPNDCTLVVEPGKRVAVGRLTDAMQRAGG